MRNQHLRHEPRVVRGLADDAVSGGKPLPFGEYRRRLCQQFAASLQMGEASLCHRGGQTITSSGSCWASHYVPKLDRVLNRNGRLISMSPQQLERIHDFRAVRIGRVEHPQEDAGIEQATHQS
ncbi:MAG TPA: hypothetical protein VJ783_26860 [Pirellulales bacterium]|nr:hypothetical protein [Pirellulales bacterium]